MKAKMDRDTYLDVLNKYATQAAKEATAKFKAGWYPKIEPQIVQQDAYKLLLRSKEYRHFGRYNETAKADLDAIVNDLYDSILEALV